MTAPQDTREAVEFLARSLAFVANRTGMTVEKCERITDNTAAMLRRLLDRAEAAERDADEKLDQIVSLEDRVLKLFSERDEADATGYARGLRAAAMLADGEWCCECPQMLDVGEVCCGSPLRVCDTALPSRILALLPADATKGTDDE